MAFLNPSDITSHIYQEVSDEITRGNATILQSSVDAAVSEAIGYLNRYDIPAILAQAGNLRNPILLLYMKDIAAWHFINLANVSIDMSLRQLRYEKAIDWFKGVQKGMITPDLPVPAPDADQPQLNSTVRFGNARERNKGSL